MKNYGYFKFNSYLYYFYLKILSCVFKIYYPLPIETSINNNKLGKVEIPSIC